MLTRSMRRILAMSRRLTFAILGLSLLAMFAVQPASATTFTYSFVISVPVLQAAFDANLSPGSDADLFGYYDLYIRPKIAGDVDFDGSTGNTIVDFSLKADDAPITPMAPKDSWLASITTTPAYFAPTGTPSFFFSAFAPGDTYVALITSNGAVAGKTFIVGIGDSRIGERLPETASFVLTLNSLIPITLGTPVRFEFVARSYEYSNLDVTGDNTKGVFDSGYIDLNTGPELPEPMPALTGGGGLLLFGLAGMRRWRKTS